MKSAPATTAIQAAIRDAAKTFGLASIDLPSFAGHDSQNITKIAPMGMIFIPSKDGISHSPKEYSSPQDGAEVLYRTVLVLDHAYSSVVENDEELIADFGQMTPSGS